MTFYLTGFHLLMTHDITGVLTLSLSIYIYIHTVHIYIYIYIPVEAVTASRLAEEYNKGLDKAVEKVQAHNAHVSQQLRDRGATKPMVERALVREPEESPVTFNARWCRRWMCLFDWRQKAVNTAGNFLEWSDPRLVAARARVQEHIQNGVHKYLILNFDQVWRQSLRSCKVVMMRGSNRLLAGCNYELSSSTCACVGRANLRSWLMCPNVPIAR